MKAQVNYALVTSDDPQQFTNSVNLAINDGFVLVGGVATVREPGNPSQGVKPKIHYSQALVRRGVNGVDITV